MPPVGREFLDYVTLGLMSPSGVWGNSSYGSAAKGEHAIAAQVQSIVEFVRQTFEALSQCDLAKIPPQEFIAEPPQIAILPLARYEPHGSHLTSRDGYDHDE